MTEVITYIAEITLEGLFLIFVFNKYLEFRNKSTLLLSLSLAFAVLTSVTRFFACIQLYSSSASLLFKISIIFTFFPPIFTVALFSELSEGRIHYGWFIPLTALLGYCIKTVFTEEIKIIGQTQQYGFVRPFLFEIEVYYFILTVLLVFFTLDLYFKGRAKFIGKETRFLLNTILIVPFLGIVAIILEVFLMSVEKIGGQYYFLIGAPFMLMVLILVFVLYKEPRFYLLTPFKVYWLIVLDKLGGVEVYSLSFERLSVSTELIGGLLTAIINYSQEIFGNRIIRRMIIPDSEVIIETSEHFLFAIVTQEYHENVPVVLNMALRELEKALNENEELKIQIERGIVDASSWSHVFEASINKVLSPILP